MRADELCIPDSLTGDKRGLTPSFLPTATAVKGQAVKREVLHRAGLLCALSLAFCCETVYNILVRLRQTYNKFTAIDGKEF